MSGGSGDEPTTGRQRLVDGCNSVVVIEHSLDVIKVADWLIGFGGEIVAEGRPEAVAKNAQNFTGTT